MVTDAVESEPVSGALIKLSKEKNANHVVVGTHGRTGFGQVLLGNVSERVIGKAKCAVLFVKA